MHSKWVFKHFYLWSGRRVRFLAVLWSLGLLVGIILCSISSYDAAGMLYSTISTPPTPLGLFLVCVLPIVFTAIALTSPLFMLSYLVVFLNAVSHGFCGIMIYIAQGNAAWLLRPLLLFSASCSSVLMWWLLLQSKTKSRLHMNIRLAGIMSCIIYIVDLFLVSPLVGDLAKYF